MKTTALPLRVDTFHHQLHIKNKNQELVQYLSNAPFKVVLETNNLAIKLFDTLVVVVYNDSDLPIKLTYFFKKVKFGPFNAVQDEYLWKDPSIDVKIEGLPLSSYILFKVLLPTFGVVVGGDRHTIAGEKWSRKQVDEAIKAGIGVFLIDENGDTFEVIEENKAKMLDHAWGKSDAHKKRRIVLST